ncbi:MAG: YlmH/Sll1252 family protein [Anaerovoracaceae bacterium]
MKEDKILIGQINDKLLKCENDYMETYTGFLTVHQRTLASGIKTPQNIKVSFEGGYQDAERVILRFLPEYMEAGENPPIVFLRVTRKPGGRELTHRDYLGSIVGLGIDRSLVGDIIVKDYGADIICLEEISEFLAIHYNKVSRTDIEVEIKNIGELEVKEPTYKEVTDTVASLRLDNIVSSAFGISRNNAVAAITKGIVFVNNIEVLKPDSKVDQGDKVVVRGKGKVLLEEIGGKSRKDRVYVKYRKY